MTLTITRAETPADLDAVRALIREFHHWAMIELAEPGATPPAFAHLDAELAALPGVFGPPSGCLLLARLNAAPAGCAGLVARDAATMEIRRMYVRPAARGHRIGERLLSDLLVEARRLGYRRYLLESHHSMRHAHAIYRRAGFREVPHPDDAPAAEGGIALCMEMIPPGDPLQESLRARPV